MHHPLIKNNFADATAASHHIAQVIANPLLLVLPQHVHELLLAIKVGPLNVARHRQLGELVQRPLPAVLGLPGAVQHQNPLEERARRPLPRVTVLEEDLELPGAARPLRPGVRGHEGPLVEAFVRNRDVRNRDVVFVIVITLLNRW